MRIFTIENWMIVSLCEMTLIGRIGSWEKQFIGLLDVVRYKGKLLAITKTDFFYLGECDKKWLATKDNLKYLTSYA